MPVGLAAGLVLSACSALPGGAPPSTVAPHVVFLARPGCPTAVANTFRGDYAVLTSLDSLYVPAVGDILEGPVRDGESVFQRYPEARANRGWGDGLPVSVRADTVEVSLADARRRYNGLCDRTAAPVPRLPGADG